MNPDRSDLGTLLGEYKKYPFRISHSILPVLVFTIGVIFPCCYGLWSILYNIAKHGLAAALEWSLPWFAGSTVFLFIIILIVINGRSRKYPIIYIYENGFLIKSGLLTKSPILWKRISAISEKYTRYKFLGKTIKENYHIAIIPTKGRQLQFTASNHQNEAIKKIKTNTYSIIYPTKRASFNEGNWIQFGDMAITPLKFKVNRNSILRNEIEYPWYVVEKLEIVNGSLSIISKDGKLRYRTATSNIQNLEIMLRLINEGVKI